jgi:choline-sulfatase
MAEVRAAARGRHPDILLIVCDQLSARATELYAPGFAASPNLDGLLRRSLRFARAYTVCPLCMPARAAMWTGRYPHETNVVSNLEPPPGVAPDFPTLGETFANAGYQTVHFGKRHDAGTLRGFERIETGTQPVAADLPVNRDSFTDADTAMRMVDYLKRRSGDDRPFLAVADFNNPHNICQFVGENEQLPLPESADLPPLPDNFRCEDWASRPLPVRHICCTHARQRQAARWTPERYRFYLYAYAQYIRMVDRQIGDILRALRETGAAERTVVVFTADHGEGMAAFGLVTKQLAFYENAVNIPLAICDPAHPERNGADRDRLVSTLDLFPTLCELAGIRPPRGVRGTSVLRPEAPDYVVSEWVSEYFNTVSPGRMLLDRRYKYVHYLEGGEELYDLIDDPGEQRNLVPRPECAALLQHRRDLLRAHLERTSDPYFSLPVIVDPQYRRHAGGFADHTGSDAVTDGRQLVPERGRNHMEAYLGSVSKAGR